MSPPETPQPETRAIPVVWTGAEDVPMLLANAFLTQANQAEFIVTVGQIQPPMIFPGTSEEIAAQAESVRFVESRVVARIGLTRPRVKELIAALQTTLDNYDNLSPESKGEEL